MNLADFTEAKLSTIESNVKILRCSLDDQVNCEGTKNGYF